MEAESSTFPRSTISELLRLYAENSEDDRRVRVLSTRNSEEVREELSTIVERGDLNVAHEFYKAFVMERLTHWRYEHDALRFVLFDANRRLILWKSEGLLQFLGAYNARWNDPRVLRGLAGPPVFFVVDGIGRVVLSLSEIGPSTVTFVHPLRGASTAQGSLEFDHLNQRYTLKTGGKTMGVTSIVVPNWLEALMRVKDMGRGAVDTSDLRYDKAFAVSTGKETMRSSWIRYGYPSEGHHSYEPKIEGGIALFTSTAEPESLWGDQDPLEHSFDIDVFVFAVEEEMEGEKGATAKAREENGLLF